MNKAMKEAFLAYIWKFRLFKQENLTTIEGEELTILSPGEENLQAGPDFFNAVIKIGAITWAGNVEIHVKASEWYQHGHQHNDDYDNVILHLVYEPDRAVKRRDKSNIPTLTIKKRLPEGTYKRYLSLLAEKKQIPCAKQFNQVDPFILLNWTERLTIERLEQKIDLINRHLQQNNNNWEATFYAFLFRAWGMKVNAEPFALLAAVLPLAILQKHADNLLQVEALLFGQAGLLQKKEGCFTDEYVRKIAKEYHYLQIKCNLTPLQKHSWKFSRLRPPNFPTIRLGQLAMLLYKHKGRLFSHIRNIESISLLEEVLAVQTSVYWENHYRLDKLSNLNKEKKLGKTFLHHLIINAIVPFLFIFGRNTGRPLYQQRALNFLEQLPAEKNKIILSWKELGVNARTAFDTQAFLQLKNNYCNKKQCLKCAIGNFLLSK